MKLYPQNGDRIVVNDFVTSCHPMYRLTLAVNEWMNDYEYAAWRRAVWY